MAIAQSNALYYPFIDIANEAWLRHAVLFWDSLSTIVPESLQAPYQTAFTKELADAGVLKPTIVNSYTEEIAELGDSVLEYLTDPAAANLLLPAFGDDGARLHEDKLPAQIGAFVRLHPDKLPSAMRAEVDGLVGKDGFLRVDNKFADYYMTLLSAKIAKRLGLSVVTDSVSANQLALSAIKGVPAQTINLSRLKDSRTKPATTRGAVATRVSEGLLVDLAFEGISIPKKVSAKKILEFKEKHKDELSIYRQEIATLAADIPSDLSIEALRAAVNDRYDQKIRPALNSLKRSLAAQAWDSGSSTLVRLSALSAGPASALVVAAGVSAPVALLVAAGVSMTATLVSMVSERKKARLASPYAYLLAVNRKWG